MKWIIALIITALVVCSCATHPGDGGESDRYWYGERWECQKLASLGVDAGKSAVCDDLMRHRPRR